MRAVYFTKTAERGPSSRYRVYQFLPWLEQAGIECAVHPLLGESYWRLLEMRSRVGRVLATMIYVAGRFLLRARQLLTMGRADLVLIEGQLFPYLPAVVERTLARLGYRLVVEFDDAIYLTRFHRKKMPQLLRVSTATIVGNPTLADYARRYASAVHVVPTVVDTARFVPHRSSGVNGSDRETRTPTIVWIGLPYNFSYLEVLIPALQAVQREFRAVFRVISSRPPDLPGVDVEFVPWEWRTEVPRLQECQIGVMPLPETEWARGKCGLKLLQYMAVALPAVASAVGVNREIIASGENGLLAATPDEWTGHLAALCRDARYRERLGTAGRRTVEERYALHRWGPRVAQAYLTIAGLAGSPDVVSPAAQPQKRCA